MSSEAASPRAGQVYFPGLNTVRLYAALSVVIIHIATYGFPKVSVNDDYRRVQEFFERFFLTGQDAVTVFFCLSGFLITYLLLDERARTKRIAVRRFYARRAARIFPLYYLILALGMLILAVYSRGYAPPDIFSFLTLIFASGHLGSAFGNLSLLGPLWSIGVEQWFYLIWPLLLIRLSVPKILVAILLARTAAVLLIDPHALLEYTVRNATSAMKLLTLMRFECIAVGALGAWLYFRRSALLSVIYRLELLFWLGAVSLAVFAPATVGGFCYDMMVSGISIGLILNISTNPQRHIHLETRLLKALGQVSYGIYMYHMLVIHVVAGLFVAAGFTQTASGDAALYLTIPALTLAIAWVSYHAYEKRFNRRGRQT